MIRINSPSAIPRQQALLVLTCLLLTLAQSAFGCQENETVIFACTTTGNNHVEVCDAGAAIHFTYGQVGNSPEIQLSVDRVDASTDQWRGFGRYISYTVYVPDGATIHSVFWREDRLTETRDISAGINLDGGDGQVGQDECKLDTLEQNLEGITLRADDLSVYR